MIRAVFSSPINALLVAAPVSWLLAATMPESPWVFLTAALALIPLAGLIGLGTEQLARRSGPGWGGFLNATFGNAAELIIAVVAGTCAGAVSFAIARPMWLLFNGLEISAIALSVLATSIVVNDGESNWVEGLQLLSVYLILALAFYFVPAPR